MKNSFEFFTFFLGIQKSELIKLQNLIDTFPYFNNYKINVIDKSEPSLKLANKKDERFYDSPRSYFQNYKPNITLDEINHFFNSNVDKINRIKEKTGIDNRYISGENENVIDISIKCSNKIFKKFPKKKINFLILVTQTSPYRIPTTACILQDKMGLKKNTIAFDINLGCSGFIYALRMGSSLIESKQAKNGLIICADTYTKYISKTNTACRPIFSDAAAAILF